MSKQKKIHILFKHYHIMSKPQLLRISIVQSVPLQKVIRKCSKFQKHKFGSKTNCKDRSFGFLKKNVFTLILCLSIQETLYSGVYIQVAVFKWPITKIEVKYFCHDFTTSHKIFCLWLQVHNLDTLYQYDLLL